jgi:hypothetical protein
MRRRETCQSRCSTRKVQVPVDGRAVGLMKRCYDEAQQAGARPQREALAIY